MREYQLGSYKPWKVLRFHSDRTEQSREIYKL